MARDGEDFPHRWSRLKRASAQAAPRADAQAAPPPALPALETLSFDSDFAAFMHSKVDEGVRRAALRKLFSDQRFNVMDGLDTYIDDYSREDPIPSAMLAQLEHARDMLPGPKPHAAEDPRAIAPTETPPTGTGASDHDEASEITSQA